ncbi:MAG: hypothetical protein K2X99_04705 [Gemmatimonadaceae bacterium]|nr:hypothetical protein [Gemmatimonadaceae bacterium]
MARPDDSEDGADVRLDKWLWAARFFKSRALATEAINGGKVEIGGQRVKPSRDVHVGETVRIRLGAFEHIITVRALSARRGPASVAQELYEETPASRAAREKLSQQMRYAAPAFDPDGGKPDRKDDRRAIRRFRGKD